jgi:hypothetical protein
VTGARAVMREGDFEGEVWDPTARRHDPGVSASLRLRHFPGNLVAGISMVSCDRALLAFEADEAAKLGAAIKGSITGVKRDPLQTSSCRASAVGGLLVAAVCDTVEKASGDSI